MTKFLFELGQEVFIAENETATIISVAEHKYNEPSYALRHTAHNGNEIDSWWSETDLAVVQEKEQERLAQEEHDKEDSGKTE